MSSPRQSAGTKRSVWRSQPGRTSRCSTSSCRGAMVWGLPHSCTRFFRPVAGGFLPTFGRAGYLRRAADGGAVGFLLKDAPASELAKAIRAVMAGRRVIDPGLALTALSEGDNPLTSRERDVLAAASGGATVADIAGRLSISEGTVRNHLSVAIQKVGGRNRFEAARLAEQKGWRETAPAGGPCHGTAKDAAHFRESRSFPILEP